MSQPSLISELKCSICLDVFTDPVSTPCGHNFCKSCLNDYWNDSLTCSCPNCKETFRQRPYLKINTALREISEYYKEKSPEKKTEAMCDICEGGKPKSLKLCPMCQNIYSQTQLELQTQDDHTCVCSLCTESDHDIHYTLLTEEESEEKKTLMKTQKVVQEMIQDRKMMIQDVKYKAEVRKRNSEILKEAGVEILSDLICCFERFEAVLLEYMEGQEKTAEKQEEELIDKLDLEIALLEQLSQTEDNLTNEDYELKWMQQYAVVNLDPDTAQTKIILSCDGKQVRCEDVAQKFPDAPHRFDRNVIVLGNEGFSTGRFYFEVEVVGKTDWHLGVARVYVDRKGELTLSSSNGFWILILRNENEYEACEDSAPPVFLSLRVKPQRVGVFVDYEEGLVCFYDVESSSHIYSFTGQSFSDNLYPYFAHIQKMEVNA